MHFVSLQGTIFNYDNIASRFRVARPISNPA
jgi:hypothetical protein